MSVRRRSRAIVLKAVGTSHKSFNFTTFPGSAIVEYGSFETRLQQFVWRCFGCFGTPFTPIGLSSGCQFIFFHHFLRRTRQSPQSGIIASGHVVLVEVMRWGRGNIAEIQDRFLVSLLIARKSFSIFRIEFVHKPPFIIFQIDTFLSGCFGLIPPLGIKHHS